jgi:hypothetical protein
MQNQYLALDFLADSYSEMTALTSLSQGLGVDGIFVDCPRTAVQWLRLVQSDDPTTLAHQPGRMSHPAAAASTFAVVGALVVICGVWVVVLKHGSHSQYKPWSPRLLDETWARQWVGGREPSTVELSGAQALVAAMRPNGDES